MKRSIFIGFDPRWVNAFAAARASMHGITIPVRGIVLDRMREAGLYWRPTEMRDNQLWDSISDAPMATEFAISRFLTPHLARTGWALFQDCDMMLRAGPAALTGLFQEVERRFADKAIVCVKHAHEPVGGTKMDGQLQTAYGRKNWSSFILFNVDHPANRELTVELINEVPGRDLHRFCWLGHGDDLIGEIPQTWNWLAGTSDPKIDPANVHYTDGIPSLKGYEHSPYAGEWRSRLNDWAEGLAPA